VADLCAGRAHALACGRLGTLDQATRGDTILHRREARHSVHVIAPPKAEDLADLGQVVWALGVVDMRQQCSAFPPQVGAAA
jgi:hypothetical protein